MVKHRKHRKRCKTELKSQDSLEKKTDIYGVYYYNMGSGPASVKFIGFYDNIKDAKYRLSEAIPDYKEHINNTVVANGRIGWINKNEFGDYISELSCSQPYSSINLFN